MTPSPTMHPPRLFRTAAAAILRSLALRSLAVMMLAALLLAWTQAHAVQAATPDREWAPLLLVESVDHPAAFDEAQNPVSASACRKPAPSKSLAIDQVLKEIADKDVQPVVAACWQTLRQAAPRPLALPTVSQTDRAPLLRPPAPRG